MLVLHLADFLVEDECVLLLDLLGLPQPFELLGEGLHLAFERFQAGGCLVYFRLSTLHKVRQLTEFALQC